MTCVPEKVLKFQFQINVYRTGAVPNSTIGVNLVILTSFCSGVFTNAAPTGLEVEGSLFYTDAVPTGLKRVFSGHAF